MTFVMSDARRKKVDDFHVMLCATHGKAFVHPRMAGHGMVPLKVGIISDLRAAFPDIEKKVIETFMDAYTSSEAYQRCCAKAGAVRVNLKGEPVGRVAEGQAVSAQKKLVHVRATSQRSASEMNVCSKTGKASYRSGGEALDSARRASHDERSRREVSAFRCTHCDRFHWGHKKPWSFVPRGMRAEQVSTRDSRSWHAE